jgi:L-asparaginase II
MNYQPATVARVFRGEAVESVHCGSVAVVDADGRLVYRVGDPYLITFMRSSSKPFQAIPVVETGAAKKFELTSRELAVIAGSHSGEEAHLNAVKTILDKIGLDESHLQCGTQPPLRYAAMKETPESGREFTPIEHNCSGKHAGMLAVAVFKGLAVDNYLSPDHPVQQIITRTISEICRYPEEKIAIGLDGCSAPNHALPLYNMALGFARLIAPNSVPKEQAKAYSAISRAMMEFPELVGGTARFDSVAAQSPGEPILSKGGAEALQCFSFIDRHLGAAIKIVDGSQRAINPVSVEFLYKLGVRARSETFNEFHRPLLKNWRNIEIGHIEPGFEIVEVEND